MSGSPDRRTVAILAGVALAGALVASFGFAAVSTNPIAPETSIAVADATDTYDLRTSGRVEMLTVTHTGGDDVPYRELQVVLGSRASGLVFAASENWTVERDAITFGLYADGSHLSRADADTYTNGTTLTVVKTGGTAPINGTIETTVRVRHLPSSTTTHRERLTVE